MLTPSLARVYDRAVSQDFAKGSFATLALLLSGNRLSFQQGPGELATKYIHVSHSSVCCGLDTGVAAW